MANGENVKVVQELMRHANCRCTLEIYSRIQAKRTALHRVVEMIFPQERELLASKTHTELLDLKEVSVKMTFRYPKSRLVLSGLVTRAR